MSEDYRPSMEAQTIGWDHDENFKWREWIDKIPYITFPEIYEVKAIPPFSNAIIRYNVRLKSNHDVWVSIYLDGYDLIGYYGSPYWELYPYEGDTFRCDMNDVDGLLKAIEFSFNEQATK